MVHAFDPDAKGRILWQTRVQRVVRMGACSGVWPAMGAMCMPAAAGSVRLRGSGNTSGFAPVGNAQFDPALGGGLTALNVKMGKRSGSRLLLPAIRPVLAAVQPNPVPLRRLKAQCFPARWMATCARSRAPMASCYGLDTAKSYATVNGVPGNGGSLDGAGPVIVGGMLFVNSGYPRFGGMPGECVAGVWNC